MTVISIANDFSSRPLGRYHPEDGQFSGERFRTKFLVPALKQTSNKISINLDGLKMLTSSFMEEAFGGLVRKEGFDAKELLDRLEFDHTDPFDENYVKEVIADIREAIPETVGA